MNKLYMISLLTLLFLISPPARLSHGQSNETTESVILHLAKKELSTRFPEARISVNPDLQWSESQNPVLPITQVYSVQYLAENRPGQAVFLVSGVNASGPIQHRLELGFQAFQNGFVANQKIRPGEMISAAQFTPTEINVANGQGREFRGALYLAGKTNEQTLEKLEARQTILAGSYLLSPSVQLVPDVRKGAALKIRFTVGQIELTSPGLAEEPGEIGRTLKVMTKTSKRSFTGTLQPDGVVEVAL